jgi:type III restriction enzyme
MLVEYKNERDWSNDDSKAKREVGDPWAERRERRCLFVMPKGKDWGAIAGAVSIPSTQSRRKENRLFKNA